MTRVMDGVRILEIAQFTFVPAAGAVLAEWGADVIKVEHPGRGDAIRVLGAQISGSINPDRMPIVQHPNRGKRSIGVDINTEEGQQVIYDLAKTADVFITNYLPAARQKHRIDIEHIRAANPNIIYARGSAFGEKGAERESGGFDATAFWSRTGMGVALSPAELGAPMMLPIPAMGDTIGSMNIAGGIAAALYHRAVTGRAVELDVSLLSTGWWACARGIASVMEGEQLPQAQLPKVGGSAGNPFLGMFTTSDGRSIALCILAPGPLIKDTFEHLGLAECALDPRFANVDALRENWGAASALLVQAFSQKPFAYWCEHLKTMKGQWAPCQSMGELAQDEQALANDMVIEVEPADGGVPIRLVRSPVQFDLAAAQTTRAPRIAEHTAGVLAEIGFDQSRIEQLRSSGIIA